MTALVIEILGFIAAAALSGFLLGYLIWGWGSRERIAAARADGARQARTALDGDAGSRAQLQAAEDRQARLEAEIDRLSARLAELGFEPDEAAAAPARSPAVGIDAARAAGREADAPAPSGTTGDRPPDLALRQHILKDTEAAVPSAGEAPGAETSAEPAPGVEAPDMPRPPAFTRLRQRTPETDAAPVADQQIPPQRRTGAAGQEREPPGPPRPPVFTSRRQRPADNGDAPVVDEQVPPDGPEREELHAGAGRAASASRKRPPEASERPVPTEQIPLADPAAVPPANAPGDNRSAGAALERRGAPAAAEDVRDGQPQGEAASRQPEQRNIPRPADSTLSEQRPGEEPPVVDEQVPPGSAAADAGHPQIPRPADSTLSGQRPGEEPPVADQQVPPPGGSPVSRSRLPVPLLEARPAEPDELRRIRGIGRVMERQLNGKGIWLYRQLAGLTPEGIAWLTSEIGLLPGRIERDGWIAQARELHREKHGSLPDTREG